jgi:transcription antitermination protein NusB
MLNRRYLRIKALQALYVFFQDADANMAKGEREMMRSVDKTYDLYISILLLFEEFVRLAQSRIDTAREKRLPTAEDLNPNLRFVNNRLIAQLRNHQKLQRDGDTRKVSWQSDGAINVIRKTWDDVLNSEEYKKYMAAETDTYAADQELVLEIMRRMADDEHFEHYLEEQNMHWPGDMNMAVGLTLLRTLETGTADREPQLAPLFKDEEDDKQFVLDLYRKTIIGNEESEKLISEKTKNWEVERIALMDVILMKMAITELTNFQNIPVKVSLNEYIEISKTYSTPKSKVFINGILDKLVADFKADGRIKKTGRGLME